MLHRIVLTARVVEGVSRCLLRRVPGEIALTPLPHENVGVWFTLGNACL